MRVLNQWILHSKTQGIFHPFFMVFFFGRGINEVDLKIVAIAVIASIFIGAIWYSPLLFGKEWMEERCLSNKEIINGRPLLIVISLNILFFLISAGALALVIPPNSGLKDGALCGFFISFVWITVSKANNTLFDRHSMRLFFIHTGFDILTYTTMGGIIGIWN